ncbi:MAG: hypothetical protein OXF84_02390 [Bacteroidetes bacterium]|nr:hypothetical protein [Bacteroidota bacterium]
MQEYQFWAMMGGFVAILVFLWKISSDNRKADEARHRDIQTLRAEMNNMRFDLSAEIRNLAERLARMEGRQEERDVTPRGTKKEDPVAA